MLAVISITVLMNVTMIVTVISKDDNDKKIIAITVITKPIENNHNSFK